MKPKICSNCKTENRIESKFCRRCGLWLLANCPYCDCRLLDGSLFCDHCGRSLNSQVTNTLPPPSAGRPEASQPHLEAGSIPIQTLHPATPVGASEAASQLQQFIPDELLRKLEVARDNAGMVGERRIVTMLFCDMQGSTAAAEQLDPEDWSEIMNGAFTHMIKPIYKYEGTVARLMGDALLAFFGAPITHEDDPQRAILAGLDITTTINPYREEILKRYGIEINVRVGINTGLVVVGAVGSDLRMEYSALGDAVNVAARMEQTAEPGSVRVAHDTYRLVSSLFDFEKLGAIKLKGKSEPVPTYKALRGKAEPRQVRGVEGLHAEMVGRTTELASLGSVLNDLRQGVGRIVLVLGEAGLGKTRLVNEAQAALEMQKDEHIEWIDTPSLSYESNQAYGLIQRLMRRIAGIRQDDSELTLLEKLAIQVQGFDEDRRPRALRVFQALFGVGEDNGSAPLEEQEFGRELYEAVCQWLKQKFSNKPTVLLFDDMHWCDAASVRLLRQLLPLTGDIPLVLLFVLRAERSVPAWQIRTVADEDYSHRTTELSLRPLSDIESNELINRLLTNPELPDGLRASIVERAGGNPFYIEEVVRALIDSGALRSEVHTIDGQAMQVWHATSEAVNFSIPDNLQALLVARLDRLEEATRGTLQIASVIGRSFHHNILQAIEGNNGDLDGNLGTLMRMDLIREAARVPEVEYTFRSPLTQEAVYQSILFKRRHAFHERVATAIEAIYEDRLEVVYGLLAHHFALADDNKKAIDYWRKAAGQAMTLFGYEDAIMNLRSALELSERSNDVEVQTLLLEELGDAHQGLRQIRESIGAYQQALELSGTAANDDPIRAVRLHRKIVQLSVEAKWNVDLTSYQNARDTAMASRKELERNIGSGEVSPHMEVVSALATLSFEAWRAQVPPDWEAAERYARSAVAMAESLDAPLVVSKALGALGNVLDGRSMLRDHLAVALRRFDLCTTAKIPDAFERLDAIREVGMSLMYVGEYEKAMPYLMEAETKAASAHSIGQQVAAIGLQSQCAFRLDRWDDVLILEEKWRDLERRYPRQRVGPTCFNAALSSSVYALRGDLEKAKAYARESVDYMITMAGAPELWQRNQFY